MNRFWTDVIEPLALELKPGIIVEIGSDEGAGTEKLLEFCRRTGARLHVIDPKPAYDADAMQARWGEALVYHRALSLEVLPLLGAVDLALIDGDHNWYTVRHELELLHATATRADAAFPLTFLHDVGWPYGRRDLYYDPATVPAEGRQAYANAGLAPGRSALVPGGGYNAHCLNAVDENTPRNGVLTAIEDFIADHPDEDFVLQILPALFGMAILYRRSDPRPPALESRLADMALDPIARAVVALAEGERIDALIEAQALQRRVDLLERRLEAAEGALESHQAALGQVSERLSRSRGEASRLQGVAAMKGAELDIRNAELAARSAELAHARTDASALREGWAQWEASFTGRAVARLRRLSARWPGLARAVQRIVHMALKARARLAGQ